MNREPLIGEPKTLSRFGRVWAGLGVFASVVVLAAGMAWFAPAQMPPPGWAGGGGGGAGGGSGTVASGTATQVAKYTAETTVGSQSTATFQSSGQLYVQGSAANDAMIFGSSNAANGTGGWFRNSVSGGQGLVGEATNAGAFPFTVMAPSGQTADLTRWLVDSSPVASVDAAGAGYFASLTDATGTLSYAAATALPCASANAGREVKLAGSVYEYVECDGTAWVPYRNGLACVPPVFGDFTRVNAGSETTSTTNGGTLISFPATSTTYSPKGWVKAEPTAPYTITSCVVTTAHTADFNILFSLGWMDGATTSDDSLVYGIRHESGAPGGWTHDVLFSAPYLTPNSHPKQISANSTLDAGDFCLQISVDAAGTPARHTKFSNSGLPGTFVEFYTATHTTTITPTHVVFGGQARQAVAPVATWVYHWKETSP